MGASSHAAPIVCRAGAARRTSSRPTRESGRPAPGNGPTLREVASAGDRRPGSSVTASPSGTSSISSSIGDPAGRSHRPGHPRAAAAATAARTGRGAPRAGTSGAPRAGAARTRAGAACGGEAAGRRPAAPRRGGLAARAPGRRATAPRRGGLPSGAGAIGGPAARAGAGLATGPGGPTSRASGAARSLVVVHHHVVLLPTYGFVGPFRAGGVSSRPSSRSSGHVVFVLVHLVPCLHLIAPARRRGEPRRPAACFRPVSCPHGFTPLSVLVHGRGHGHARNAPVFSLTPPESRDRDSQVR